MSLPSGDLEELRQDVKQLSIQLQHAGTHEEASTVAIKAAASAVAVFQLEQDPIEKAKCSTRAKQLLGDAEAIKCSPESDWRNVVQRVSNARSRSPPEPTKVRVLKEPRNSRALSNREKIVVLKAGFLNGAKFPEWEKPPSPSDFELRDGEGLFLDEHSELPLADFQQKFLDSWKRPDEALPPPHSYTGDRSNLGPTMSFHQNIDLVQDAATDCSVVASLCAGVARAMCGHSRLMESFMFPFDAENGCPKMSENGKYIIRMNFNGCFRKVVIDDRLPMSSSKQVIHVIDRNNPGLLWPALLEKAYLKVRGGYDFPGSNSATDLWIITGWIPEQVFLQSDELDLAAFWERMSAGFSYGDVFVTLGTGKMSSKTERAIGLAGEHDYAVLDAKEVDGQQLLLIKNPWVDGTVWRGSKGSTASAVDKSNTGEPQLQVEDGMEPVKSPRDLLNDYDKLEPGTFWMDLNNVVQYFESIYLNWNPGLFSFRQDAHFAWDLSKSTSDKDVPKVRGPWASLQNHTQYTVTVSRQESIWLVLWRHFQNSVPEDATVEEIESGRHHIDLDGHITMAVFCSNGYRVLIAEKYIEMGWFVDSPQTLIKLDDCEPGRAYTVVPLERDLPATHHSFTLSAFSAAPLTLADAKPRYANKVALTAGWGRETAGGNAQHTTYCNNPQFAIAVDTTTSLSLLLEACDQQVNVHVKLLHGQGQRMWQIRNRDIIVDSKDYRLGCCHAEIEDLEPGKYTIICSTFEPQQLGNFSLYIESSQPIRAAQLPRDGAGHLQIDLPTAAFKNGETKIAAPMAMRTSTKMYAIVRHFEKRGSTQAITRRSQWSQVRLSVELGRGPERRIMIASNNGEYSDGMGVVRTVPVGISKDKLRNSGQQNYWIVLDRVHVNSESQEEQFSVFLFVDTPGAVEVGVWRNWDD